MVAPMSGCDPHKSHMVRLTAEWAFLRNISAGGWCIAKQTPLQAAPLAHMCMPVNTYIRQGCSDSLCLLLRIRCCHDTTG
jgi:hypothetical protein